MKNNIINKFDGAETADPVFNLKIKESSKYANDNQWFKDYMGYVVQGTTFEVEDFDIMKTSYEVANNNLDGYRKQIQDFCAPLGLDMGQIEEDMVPYPELYNKINILKGEMLSRGDDFKIVLLTSKAIKDKNDALYEAIKMSVDEKLGLVLEKNKQQMQGMDEKQAQEYITQLRTQLEPEDLAAKSWQSEQEIFYSSALKYCYYDQDVKSKKLETFEDVINADRCFIYSGWKNGKPHLEVRNPLFVGFHKSPNEKFIHKGDYIWYRRPLSIADVYNSYDLSKEDLTSLGINSINAGIADKRHGTGKNAQPLFDHISQDMLMATDKVTAHDKTIGTHMANGKASNRQADLVWETHFEFKAFKEIIFLSYIDEYNMEVVTVMPSSFSDFIPDSATTEKFTNRYGNKSTRLTWIDKLTQTEYKAEKLWVPRKYEIVRLGTDLYPIAREVPNQYTNIEDPFGSFNLSTFAAVFTSRNAKSVSLLQRAIPAYFQYIEIKHIENKELAKYLGSTLDIDVDQIPDDLGKDFDGNDVRSKFMTWFATMKKTGINFYSGTQHSLGGLPPATRSPGSKGTSFDNAMNIFNLQQLAGLIKNEIGLAMGISPQREAMYTQGSNVSDNQQAITQSYHITEPYFYLHNEIWKQALNDYLLNFRTYCNNIFVNNPTLKDHSFQYVMPNGVQELLRVTPQSLTSTAIGLYVTDSGQSQKYLDTMFQNAFNFIQNPDSMEITSSLLKNITSGESPSEIHKEIVLLAQKQAERQQQTQQAQLESQEKITKMQIDNREDEQAARLDEIRLKAELDRQTRIEVATITSMGFAQDTDVNDNNVPDVVDLMNHDLKAAKLSLDIKTQKDNVELKKEDLRLKEKAINKKPKTTSK